MRVIPSAIEISQKTEYEEEKEDVRIPDVDSAKKKQLLYVGRLSQEKGPDRLLKSWAAIARRHRDWELVYVGDGPMKEELEKRISVLGLSDRCG